MNRDFDSMQSVKFAYNEPLTRGWVHSSLIAYTLCIAVIAMSSVVLLVKANQVDQEQRLVKHHP